MEQSRNLKKNEIEIIEYLANVAQYPLVNDWYNYYQATPMDDGGMGSLLLTPVNVSSKEREFQSQIADCIIEDTDGMDVIISLNIDQNRNLFELDVWKCDFSPLIGKLDKGRIKRKKIQDLQ